jgi:hypothetical protein
VGRILLQAKRSLHCRGGHAKLFFAISIPQLEGSTSTIAIPQLLKKCCSTTTTPQLRNSAIAIFSEVRNFKSATLELHFHIFWHIFGCGIQSILEKKSEVKNVVVLSL